MILHASDELILNYMERQSSSLLPLLLSIAQIPSQTGKEQKKAQFIFEYIKKLGYTHVLIDDISNCIVELPSQVKGGKKKTILVVAHIDTACDPGQKVRIREDQRYVYGHGVCDNSAGVTGVLTTLSLIQKHNIKFPNNFIFAFTVGEEGLGLKRGMKSIIKKYRAKIDAVINVESHQIGRVTNQTIGQYRCELTINTKEGGHSYRDFGKPNVNVILANIISDFSHLKLFSTKGRTTFNIAQLKGEGSINSIATVASCLLEIRAEQNNSLEKSKAGLKEIVKKYKKQFQTIEIKINALAEVPAVLFPIRHQIYQYTMEVQKQLGIVPKVDAGNTDGDVSLADGIPTVTIGTARGWKTHSLEEYMEKESLVLGIKQVFRIINTIGRNY